MRRRVLIVVSSYRPVLLADMQRARTLAWELPKLGWEVEILAPRCGEVRQDAVEPDPDGLFCPTDRIHEFGSIARRLFRFFHSHSLSWTTLWPLYRRGKALLASNRFDIVYFSTTTFAYFWVGALWRQRFGTPYVLDFHDPWVRVDPAGGSWKSWLLQWLSIRMERAAVVNADGLVSVSPDYIDILRLRYQSHGLRWLADGRHAAIQFSASERDLVQARNSTATHYDYRSDELLINYVGAGGSIMFRSFELICRALGVLRLEGNVLVDRVRVRLFGTMYGWRRGEPTPLELIAKNAGVGDLVRELPGRVSYRMSVRLLVESDGALILGVDDAGYMPSKLFTYALSGKPLLASLRNDGPAFAHFQRAPALGHALWFGDSAEMRLPDAAREVNAFLEEVAARRHFDRRTVLRPYLDAAMAQRHVELFEACLG